MFYSQKYASDADLILKTVNTNNLSLVEGQSIASPPFPVHTPGRKGGRREISVAQVEADAANRNSEGSTPSPPFRSPPKLAATGFLCRPSFLGSGGQGAGTLRVAVIKTTDAQVVIAAPPL